METTIKPSPTDHCYSRRQFLHYSGALILAGGLLSVRGPFEEETLAAEPPTAEPKPPVGSQLYGWGQYYARKHENASAHLDEIFTALHDIGYDYAEGSFDSVHPENNLRFADQLRAKGLRPVSIYTGARLHEAGKASEVIHHLLSAAKSLQAAGFSVLNCNPEPIGREKTDAELKVQAAALTELGRGLRQLGLKLGIHNHTPAMRDHARELRYNFQHTPPDLVGFCFDVHWVYRGGLSPLKALAAYGDRVVCWHLRQSRHGIWWQDLADGDVDYPAIARYVKAHRISAPYSVELALEKGTRVTRSVIENHRLSREYVRKVFGV